MARSKGNRDFPGAVNASLVGRTAYAGGTKVLLFGTFRWAYSPVWADHTFVQFYPTLLEVAEAKGTLNSYYVRPAPTANRFYHMIESDGWQKASAVYQDAKKRDPESDLFQEQTLNRVAYQLLGSGKKQEAAELFKLAATTWPTSANAQDSLAECLEGLGSKAEALAATRRALSLAEKDSSLDAERKQRLLEGAKARLARLQ